MERPLLDAANAGATKVGEGKLATQSGTRMWLSARRRRPEAHRDVLVVFLILATGATDAIGYLRLGGVFTSVMTGNIVLMGVSGGKDDGSLALHTGAALLGYVIGSWIGARVAGPPLPVQSVWPSGVTRALGVEFGILSFFAIWWELAGGHPANNATFALIAVNSVALGVQSGAVLRFGIPGLSTTYLTGTLTQVIASVTRRSGSLPARSVASLVALLTGAALGAIIAINVPRAAPAVPLGVLLVVVGAASIIFGDVRPKDPAPSADQPSSEVS